MVRIPRAIVLFVIKLYQHTLSPDHGAMKVFFPDGCCKFSPTCSEYTYHKVKKHGIAVGMLKGLWQLIRCNPCTGR